MTPEERAEARRLAGQVARDREDDCDCAECRLASATEAALDALEAAERERDEALAFRNRLATDALVALAGSHVCTPVEGYVKAPHCLTANIEDLRQERDTARAQVAMLAEALDKAKRDFTLAVGWMNAVIPDMECRNDEDCDHCLGLQIVNDWPVGAETEYQSELEKVRAQVAALAEALKAVMEYARHGPCGLLHIVEPTKGCTCGFHKEKERARAALKAAGVET